MDMFVSKIIPLLAIPRNQNQLLSYFSPENLPPGSLVRVSIRNKPVQGIVFSSEPLKRLKISLRKEADFAVKPIDKIISQEPVLSSSQFRTALWLSSWYFAPLGLCLKTILPPFFNKKKYPLLKFIENRKESATNLSVETIKTHSLLNHHRDYKHILDTFKETQSLLLVPEIPYLDYFAQNYRERRPEILHSGISNEKFYAIYQKVAAGKPILLIGTRIAAFLPFKNLGLIILDNESNGSSRSDTTPQYAIEELATYLARQHGAKLIINDLLPRTESYYHRPQALEEKSQLRYDPPPVFVNLVDEIKEKNFSPFSKKLQEDILETADRKGKIILFIPRKGYALSLVCKKCSETIKCANCSSSMVVHEMSPEKKILKCHHCQSEQPLITVCPLCCNFMLEYRGVGTQKIRQKLKDLFYRQNKKEPTIFELSNDTAPREQDEKTIIRSFNEPGGSVLVATQKIFRWQYLLKADLIGIVNITLSSSFPDFRTEENTLRSLTTLAQMARKTIIQGFNPDSPALRAFLDNNFQSFFKEAWETRKLFSYPPFSDLIKLNLGHKNPTMIKEAKIVVAKLKQEIKNRQLEKLVEVIGPHPALTLKEKGLYSWNIILKIKNLETKKRNELLHLVPSRYWRIEVNPKEIL